MTAAEIAAIIAVKQSEIAELVKQLAALGNTTAPVPSPATEAVLNGTVTITDIQGQTITVDKVLTKGMVLRLSNTRSVNVTSSGTQVTIDQPVGNGVITGSLATVTKVPGTTAPTPSQPTDTSYLRKKGRVGVNAGMGAGADHVIPGKMGTNFDLPSVAEIVRSAGYGFKIQRWGFLLGRVFKDSGTTKVWRGIDAADATRKYTLDTLIDRLETAADNGVKVLLDNHAYGYFPSNGASGKQLIGSAGYTAAQFAAQWLYVVAEIKKNAKAWSAVYGFDLTNEPYEAAHDAGALVKIYQAVIDLVAPISEDRVFVLEGPGYSSTRNWVANWKGLFSNITHPRGKAFIEPSGHLYLDQGADGYYDEGDTLSAADIKTGVTFATVGTSRAKEFKAWAKAEGYNANFGENLVTGTMTQLLTGEAALLAENYADGTDTYLFGLGDWFGSNPHNIELAINAPMLALAKTWAAKGNS